MKRVSCISILCLLAFAIYSTSVRACPDCSLTAHTIGQPFFAHVMPEQTYQGTPLERNQARQEESKEGCTHCGETHE